MRLTSDTHPELFAIHDTLTPLERKYGFDVADEDFAKFRAEADTAVPQLTAEQKDVWALYSAHQHPGSSKVAATTNKPISYSSTRADVPGVPKALTELSMVVNETGKLVSQAIENATNQSHVDLDSHVAVSHDMTCKVVEMPPLVVKMELSIPELRPRVDFFHKVVIGILVVISTLLAIGVWRVH